LLTLKTEEGESLHLSIRVKGRRTPKRDRGDGETQLRAVNEGERGMQETRRRKKRGVHDKGYEENFLVFLAKEGREKKSMQPKKRCIMRGIVRAT